MPSFTAALSRNCLPPFLILAVCAVAAPFSKSSQVKTSPPRMAGMRFYQDAVNIMFDTAGRLVCEPDLETIQALCLLECHEINAQYSWAKSLKHLGISQKFFTKDVHAKFES
jgi:Fungal specific transcription factor domain